MKNNFENRPSVEKEPLDNVISSYEIVLVDTSVLIGHLNGNSHNKERIEFQVMTHNSAQFFREYFIRNQLYVTEGVLKEYAKLPFIPNYSGVNGKNHNDILKKRSEIVSRSARASRDLADLIEERSVISLNDKERELYNVFRQTMRFCEGSYRLSETDLDLLASAAVLAKLRGPTAVLSNDISMRKIWGNYLGLSCIDRRDFGFFTRMHFNKTDVFEMCW